MEAPSIFRGISNHDIMVCNVHIKAQLNKPTLRHVFIYKKRGHDLIKGCTSLQLKRLNTT